MSFDLAGIVSRLPVAAPTWDVFILAFFVIGSLLYGFALGRERVLMVIISIYMALAVVTNAPYLERLTATVTLGSLPAFRITVFLGVFLILFFILSQSALLRHFTLSAQGAAWQVLLFSFLHVGLLISVTLSFLPASALSALLPMTRKLFVSELARFLWIVLPILAMILVRGKKSRHDEAL